MQTDNILIKIKETNSDQLEEKKHGKSIILLLWNPGMVGPSEYGIGDKQASFCPKDTRTLLGPLPSISFGSKYSQPHFVPRRKPKTPKERI